MTETFFSVRNIPPCCSVFCCHCEPEWNFLLYNKFKIIIKACWCWNLYVNTLNFLLLCTESLNNVRWLSYSWYLSIYTLLYIYGKRTENFVNSSYLWLSLIIPHASLAIYQIISKARLWNNCLCIGSIVCRAFRFGNHF